MSRTRIVKGTYTKISQEGHSMYSKENIITSAGESVTETGVGQGVKYGDPKSPPKSEKRVIDIVMFVAGTTDPINTAGLKHQANTDYWRSSKTNFWNKIKDLKPQYLDLHIEGDFFSWSGDNDTKERNLAADRLLDLFLRVYKFWKNQEVHIHLIGHSHGGNVINQFTELIATDSKYPKPWKVKSITYLSTPFFKKKHQLNHSKLHKECKIINVHNEYDLTQQLIADFSLVNLEIFLRNFQMSSFQTGIDTLRTVDTAAFKHLLNVWIDNDTEGPELWTATATGLSGINQITVEFINYLENIKPTKPNLTREMDQFITLLKTFQHWTFVSHGRFNANRVGRRGGYGRSEFFEDLDLAAGIRVINNLFSIKTGVTDSFILNFLAKVFAAESGITDSIEVTSWSPVLQTKALPILDVNITEKDDYHSRNKKAACSKFIADTSNAVHKNNLQEVLMRLLSQFVDPKKARYVTYALHGAEVYFTGEIDAQIKILRKNLGVYIELVKQYNVGLVTAKDEKEIKDMMKRPGTVPYLAMAAHSLSHTQFWPEVEQGLKNAFSSGVNPGYKKKATL
ncbi:lipase family protein [Chryseobacterium bernardetii]|uniref:Alpha/beta hydrolase n=1 Tax=Chryseobacterium bernardetii TaxID=1241978 RepID=A0A3G6UAK8_9FLAO|nr:hypothetical protein [Chryseobacterium bernardetii]AZB25026.1 hypothetical protein EG339_10725 [Chryseobacterium bernardetii]AZB35580.1 hypothetical protein EG351_19575 [Chryseobacterium bernardetii]